MKPALKNYLPHPPKTIVTTSAEKWYIVISRTGTAVDIIGFTKNKDKWISNLLESLNPAEYEEIRHNRVLNSIYIEQKGLKSLITFAELTETGPQEISLVSVHYNVPFRKKFIPYYQV